jgi:PAS domain S-box-containing protein
MVSIKHYNTVCECLGFLWRTVNVKSNALWHLSNNKPTFEDLELLAEVSQLLTLVDLDRVLQQVIGLAMKAVGATKASLFLHDHDDVDWAHIFTMRDLPIDQAINVVSKVLDDGFAGWVYTNKRGDIIADTTSDDRWITFKDDPVQVRSALCVPFLHNGEVLAVMTLVHPEAEHFVPYHLRLMQIIANQATNAIRNAQLVSTLRAHRRQLTTILESIRDVLLVLDQDGHIILANDVARVLLGIDEQSLSPIGRDLAEFIQKDDVFVPITEIINNQLAQDEQWSFDTRSERHQTDYQVTMSRWRDNVREEVGYVVVMHNVTTLHDLARFKDEMLRVATHDLRSPLALISGYVDMIVMDTPDEDAPIHEYVKVVKRNVDRMGDLIDDLLRVERIRSSPLELHEQTDLEALVKVVLVNMRPAALAKEITFTGDLALKDAPKIKADTVLLRQAMENLISNAIKYTPEKGRIGVRGYVDGDKFRFYVQDSGIGIPQEHLNYVFESFYRVQGSTTQTQKGNGLGLSLVKNVIKRHGGEVWVKSQVSKGSRFGFWLPLST